MKILIRDMQNIRCGSKQQATQCMFSSRLRNVNNATTWRDFPYFNSTLCSSILGTWEQTWKLITSLVLRRWSYRKWNSWGRMPVSQNAVLFSKFLVRREENSPHRLILFRFLKKEIFRQQILVLDMRWLRVRKRQQLAAVCRLLRLISLEICSTSFFLLAILLSILVGS